MSPLQGRWCDALGERSGHGQDYGSLAIPAVTFYYRNFSEGDQRFPAPVNIDDFCLMSPAYYRHMFFLSPSAFHYVGGFFVFKDFVLLWLCSLFMCWRVLFFVLFVFLGGSRAGFRASPSFRLFCSSFHPIVPSSIPYTTVLLLKEEQGTENRQIEVTEE